MITRCAWVSNDSIYIKYHDEEWGVPVHDDKKHFEFLILEGAQAGLSWLTVLKRREGYRKAFANFNPNKVAIFNEVDVQKLMSDTSIIRNRLKIESAIKNAKVFLEIQKEFGGFDKYLTTFSKGRVIKSRPKSLEQMPVRSELSDILSKDLKKRGMSFVGSTIIYAYLQAIGVADDHMSNCFKVQ